jgi:hypothetical protein
MKKSVLAKSLLFIFVSVFLLNNILASDLNLGINGELGSYSADFYLKTNDEATNGVDSYDLRKPPLPTDVAYFYSVVSGANLIVDSFNSLPRTANAVFSLPVSSSGTLGFSWSSLAGSGYNSNLLYYRGDSGYSTLVDTINMRNQTSFSDTISSLSSVYLKFEIDDYSYCGDGYIEGDEVCDSSDFLGKTCVTEGFTAGSLACSADCLSISTAGCTTGGGSTPPPTCTNDCSAGSEERTCSNNYVVSVKNCGDYDDDVCLEFGGEVLVKCKSTEICSAGKCVAGNCDSFWNCSTWSLCLLGTQSRTCKNTLCAISDKTETQSCTICTENWKCKYTECSEGDSASYPYDCVDLNSCGTTKDKPTASVKCEERPAETEEEEELVKRDDASPSCISSWVCSSFGECSADYGMDEVLNGNVAASGKKERTCVDLNGCYLDKAESISCSLSIPIYAKRNYWCGEYYLDLFDSNTNVLVSRIKESQAKGIENFNSIGLFSENENRLESTVSENPVSDISQLDILFVTGEQSNYCDYCYDGEQNYDEEGLDCGGPSCAACEKVISLLDWAKYVVFGSWIFSLVFFTMLLFSKNDRNQFFIVEKSRDLKFFIVSLEKTPKNIESNFDNWFKKESDVPFDLSKVKLEKRKKEGKTRGGRLINLQHDELRKNLMKKVGSAVNLAKGKRIFNEEVKQENKISNSQIRELVLDKKNLDKNLSPRENLFRGGNLSVIKKFKENFDVNLAKGKEIKRELEKIPDEKQENKISNSQVKELVNFKNKLEKNISSKEKVIRGGKLSEIKEFKENFDVNLAKGKEVKNTLEKISNKNEQDKKQLEEIEEVLKERKNIPQQKRLSGGKLSTTDRERLRRDLFKRIGKL